MIGSLVIVLIGAVATTLGVWTYVDERAGRFLKRVGVVATNSEALGMMYLPAGLGLMLIGIAFAVGRNSVTVVIFAVGIAAMAVGMVLWLVHPRWAQPRWMRPRDS